MTSTLWTIVGYWNGDDDPIPVAVIAGAHTVTGGEGCSEGGPWATAVMAPDYETAERLAIAEMTGEDAS